MSASQSWWSVRGQGRESVDNRKRDSGADRAGQRAGTYVLGSLPMKLCLGRGWAHQDNADVREKKVIYWCGYHEICPQKNGPTSYLQGILDLMVRQLIHHERKRSRLL